MIFKLRIEWAPAHATMMVHLRAGDSVKVEQIWGGTTTEKSMNYFYGYLIEET